MDTNDELTWVEFEGCILKETSKYIDICATDGSNGHLRVKKNDLLKINGKLKVRVGAKVVILKEPFANKSCTAQCKPTISHSPNFVDGNSSKMNLSSCIY